ncbi:MAG: hypothetical protein AABX94_01350, partial [Nanoarchaeota archaeon]
RGKYRDALKAYREIKVAIDHLDSDHFHTSLDEDREKILSNYSSRLKVWRSQIPEELHPVIYRDLNMLRLHIEIMPES